MSSKTYLQLAWGVSLVATLGSLFFSEIAGYVPCLLCWYQRIFMYPIVILTPIAIAKKDQFLRIYLYALAIPGALIALYHNLLTWGIIAEKLAPCQAGISCVTQPVELLGFVTIPFLSLLAFLAILVLVRLSKNKPTIISNPL